MSNEKGQYKCTRTRTPDIHLFCADAAKPGYWSDDIQRALQPPSSSPQKGNKNELPSQNQKEETYLLALDTLYHFRPSRTPLLTHAATTLHATLLAFDLLLASTTTPPPTPHPPPHLRRLRDAVYEFPHRGRIYKYVNAGGVSAREDCGARCLGERIWGDCEVH